MELLNELADLDIAPAAMAKVQALFAQQQAKLAEKDFKITALTHELAYYKRVRFGKASEALVGEQRLLFEETVDTDLAAIDEELEAQAPVKRQRKRAGRQPLPAHLERIEHRHEPASCQCGQCGANLVKIGEDVSEQLDRGGGMLDSVSDAQKVLDAYRAGAAQVLGKSQAGFPVVRFEGVTGINVNLPRFPSQPTNVFMIKGTSAPSVVPMNPTWTP